MVAIPTSTASWARRNSPAPREQQLPGAWLVSARQDLDEVDLPAPLSPRIAKPHPHGCPHRRSRAPAGRRALSDRPGLKQGRRHGPSQVTRVTRQHIDPRRDSLAIPRSSRAANAADVRRPASERPPPNSPTTASDGHLPPRQLRQNLDPRLILHGHLVGAEEEGPRPSSRARHRDDRGADELG